MGEALRGVVKWFNDAKGFGFIEHTSGRDVFVHYSVIEWDGFKTLKDGEEVEYELKEGEKGLHAARVARPQALQKKIEKGTTEMQADGVSESAHIAPNLETGNVSTEIKPASAMIEVEKQDIAENTEDVLAEQLEDSSTTYTKQ